MNVEFLQDEHSLPTLFSMLFAGLIDREIWYMRARCLWVLMLYRDILRFLSVIQGGDRFNEVLEGARYLAISSATFLLLLEMNKYRFSSYLLATLIRLPRCEEAFS